MGSNDESSNDIEQGEKILFYYPPETPLSQQLSKITMIEGLIEFSNKFSSDPIDTVVMEKNTWGFYQCDPDIWIIVAIENGSSQISPELPGSHLRHSPNGTGIQNAIKKLYSIFSSFYSSLHSLITAGGSWALIDHVRTVRKTIRKLNQSIAQIERDIESTRRILEPQRCSEVASETPAEGQEAHESENSSEEQTRRESFIQQKLLSLQELEASLASIREQIQSNEVELQRLLEHPKYTPRDVRKHLSSYMTWYLHTGELISPSGITGMWGMHFSPSGFPNFHTIHRIRQCLSAPLCDNIQILGCTILCEGQVVWNDFLDSDILCLYEYLRLKETMKIREQACYLSRNLPNGSGSGGGVPETKLSRALTTSDLDESEGAVPVGDPSQSAVPEHELPSVRKKQLSFPSVGVRRRVSDSNAEIMRKQQNIVETTAKSIRERKGFLRSGWEIVDFTQADPTETGYETADDEMDHMCEGPGKIWCPRVHISANMNALLAESATHPMISSLFSSSTPSPTTPQSSLPPLSDPDLNPRICLGRGVVYREESFHVLILLRDWESQPSDSFPTLCRSQMSPAQLHLLLSDLQTRLASAISLSRETQSAPFPHSPRPPTKPSQGRSVQPGATAEILDCVGFIYSNDCNAAFKAANLSRSQLSPLYSWPSPLPQPCQNIIPLLIHSRLRFPSSTAQVAGSLPPKVVAAISDLLCSISGELTQRGHLKEACIRVSSVHRGGVWVLVRRLGERNVVFVVESCNTLNDMHELINRTSETILGNIMI